VRNARHDIVAMNSLARALYSPVLHSAAAGATSKRPANTTRFLYLDPAAREFFIDFDHMAADAAAMLRLEAGRNPYDKDLITLVGELSTQSELFRRQWASQNVTFHRSGRQRLRHPASANSTSTSKPWNCLLSPPSGSTSTPPTPTRPTEDGIKLLATWAATRSAERSTSVSRT
jgi:MmyB-like transcription regulator ligand binding domain